ncbi:MAG: hypothetical protein KME05_04250 [Gloeocapsa sp. UFS-A4-WI-NPMV-4B04]|nr:hypothetical protein [Gloeocapsa sp. UFS-A4-WI-NPMV-4B04]
MTPEIDISSLSNQDLSALEQEILAEESRRVMNSSTAIVVEPDAPEESHQDAIKKLLERKSQESFADDVVIFRKELIKFQECLKAFKDKAFNTSLSAQIQIVEVMDELFEAIPPQNELEKNTWLPFLQGKDLYQLEPLLKSVEKTLNQLELDNNIQK